LGKNWWQIKYSNIWSLFVTLQNLSENDFLVEKIQYQEQFKFSFSESVGKNCLCTLLPSNRTPQSIG